MSKFQVAVIIGCILMIGLCMFVFPIRTLVPLTIEFFTDSSYEDVGDDYDDYQSEPEATEYVPPGAVKGVRVDCIFQLMIGDERVHFTESLGSFTLEEWAGINGSDLCAQRFTRSIADEHRNLGGYFVTREYDIWLYP